MIDAIEVVRAQELLDLGQMVAVAVAAGMALSGAAGNRQSADAALSRYNQWVSGKHAVIQGTVGFDVDEHGIPILHGADDIRRWFMEKGQIRI